MVEIIRCPKCGYTQKASPDCQSCGLAMIKYSSLPAAAPPVPEPNPSRSSAAPARTQAEAPSPATPPKADGKPSGELAFHGLGGSLFGIHVVNIFLTLLTMGVYFFWGKSRVRNYLYGQTEFSGDRFAYHGTGRELFIGFLKAAVIFGAISALFQAGPLLPGGIVVKIAAILTAYALLLTFIPVAMVGSRRYRFSRTSWRGIRFSFRGKMAEFIKLFIRGTFLTLFTAGIYYPFFLTKQYAFMANDSYFGNRQFSFDGNGKDIFGVYLKAFAIWIIWSVVLGTALPLVLISAGVAGEAALASKKSAVIVAAGGVILMTGMIVLGLKTFLTAKRQSYFWNHTTIDAARFHCTINFMPLLILTLTNFFILIFTLGFGWSWTAARKARFYMSNIRLEGAFDPRAIQQEAQSASPTGDALEGLLDVDVGFGPA